MCIRDSRTADEVVDEMMKSILADLPFASGDEVAVLVNGLGATPKEELYVLFRRVSLILKNAGISVFHVYVGEYATSMEMAGASISLLKPVSYTHLDVYKRQRVEHCWG